MQNQGVISYIFPHFGLNAQPVGKEEVYTSSFFVFCQIIASKYLLAIKYMIL